MNIDRINELARKQKKSGLTKEEQMEQKKLREEYIKNIRNNMRATLNSISILEEDGTVTDLGKKHGNIREV